jgi:hypothetical protein
MTPSIQGLIAFVFGVVFLIALITLAVRFPRPTSFQYSIFRIVMALAAAGVAAMIPGFLDVQVTATTRFLIRAGGAIGVFVIVYFFKPARMTEGAADAAGSVPNPPAILPSGRPFLPEMQNAFREVWLSLIALQRAGEELWQRISDDTLVAFGERLAAAQNCVGDNALFFSEEDHAALEEALKAANIYLDGKNRVSDLRRGDVERVRRSAKLGMNIDIDAAVAAQITQNRRWLTRYENLLRKTRSRLHQSLVA